MSRYLPEPLRDNDWEALTEGDTLRVHCNHPKCEDKNDAFTITRIINGCIYNCYRCGTSGVIHRGSNPGEAIRRIGKIRSNRYNDCGNGVLRPVVLPRDFIPLVTYDDAIPAEAHAWLYQYELDDEDMDTYGWGYSPRLERVCVPVYANAKLIAWQGRDVFYKKNMILYNKGYLKKKPLKYYTEYNNQLNNNNKLYYIINNKNNNNIILVEDIISCIKVYNTYKYNVIALLNSTLHNGLIEDLNLRTYNTTYVWLDPDAHIKSVQGALRWQRMGLNVRAIRTSTDPKDVPYANMPKLRIN